MHLDLDPHRNCLWILTIFSPHGRALLWSMHRYNAVTLQAVFFLSVECCNRMLLPWGGSINICKRQHVHHICTVLRRCVQNTPLTSKPISLSYGVVGGKSKHFTVFSSAGDHTYSSFPQRLVLKDVIQPMCCDAVVNSMWRAISLVLTHQLIMDDLRCVGRNLSFLHFPLYWSLHGVLSLLLS